jgi:hypothetical protein
MSESHHGKEHLPDYEGKVLVGGTRALKRVADLRTAITFVYAHRMAKVVLEDFGSIGVLQFDNYMPAKERGAVKRGRIRRKEGAYVLGSKRIYIDQITRDFFQNHWVENSEHEKRFNESIPKEIEAELEKAGLKTDFSHHNFVWDKKGSPTMVEAIKNRPDSIDLRKELNGFEQNKRVRLEEIRREYLTKLREHNLLTESEKT